MAFKSSSLHQEYNAVVKKDSPFQKRLAFTITRRCNLRCRHCLADAAPSAPSNTVPETDMSLQALHRWIDEAMRSGKIRSIAFTGGEPFLAYDNLVEGVTRATRYGLVSTVVTNAYWASSIERARAHLSPLQLLGVLKLSTDVFHQELVPLAWVRNAVQVAAELGIQVRIKFAYLEDRDDELAEIKGQLNDLVSDEQIVVGPVYRLGRATRELEDKQFTPCDLDLPCTAANTPLIHPDGSVYACCGPTFDGENPLLLGNLHRLSLADILHTSETNVILHFLRLWGPRRLWKLCQDNRDLNASEFDTTSSCSLCFDLMTNSVTQEILRRKAQDVALYRQVAAQRLLFLQEATMLARLRDG